MMKAEQMLGTDQRLVSAYSTVVSHGLDLEAAIEANAEFQRDLLPVCA
jgi:hypothetical protein